MAHAFHVVDVFAREKYAGNQLAVVEDAADLTDEEMGAIAAEFDFSETTFVESTGPEGGWDVRIFTPEEEIPFAGHPTLGTAWTIRERIAGDRAETVALNLGVGEVPVTVEASEGSDRDDAGRSEGEMDRDRLWMRQQPPEFRETFEHDRLAAVLGLHPDDLDREYPVQAVSTGLPTTVVPLRDRDALAGIDLDRAAYDAFVDGHEARNVLAFCPDPRDPGNDIAARVFAPYYGVPEDPATGSSNGCLAGYLVRNDVLGPVEARVEQGYEMGRPSLLSLYAREADGGIAVEVGGSVVPVATGTLS